MTKNEQIEIINNSGFMLKKYIESIGTTITDNDILNKKEAMKSISGLEELALFIINKDNQ